MESAYEACLVHELTLRGFAFDRQRPIPIVYKGVSLDAQYRLDLVVEGVVIVELKAVAELLPIHEAQLITYLRLTTIDVGLLFNFNAVLLRNGTRRIFRPGANAYAARIFRQ